MKTRDYSIFKDIDGNRKINTSHVDKLAEAIDRKNLLQYIPILCNEYMEVIDGQHRLSAAVKLGLEVHYEKVPGLRIEDVMQLNTNSKSWTLSDFIDSWIVLEKPDYQILKSFIQKYSINPSVAAQMLQGYSGMRFSGSISKLIKGGSFKVASQDFAEKIAEQMMKLRKYSADNLDPMKDRELISAIMRLNANRKFDFERLIAKIKLHDLTIEKRPSEKYYILHIEELYNFRNSIHQDLYKSTYEATIARPFKRG